MKDGRKAKARLHWLTRQMGMSLANCRKVMTACIQSVAIFDSELWWKGEYVTGTKGRTEDLQLLVNQEARATTGCIRTTSLGALLIESGLRAAATRLENRQWWFGLRLLSLPKGGQAQEVVGIPTAIGRWLTNALAHRGQVESTVLLEEPETLDAVLIQEEEAEAKMEAEKTQPGLTMFTDGSRMEDGAAGFAVVWKNGQIWEGVKAHMGYNQVAYDAECTALACALESVLEGYVPEWVTIFSDTQAAIRRMASDEPGPGQQYACQTRRYIATLCRVRPDITIEIRWYPAREGIVGNEKADEWAKSAAEKPSACGVENLAPLPRSLANFKWAISEKKWAKVWQCAGERTSKVKYHMPKSQRPDGAVADSTKRLASRYYQLNTGHSRTGQYLHWAKVRSTTQCWWCQCPTQTRDDLFKVFPERKMQQKTLWAEVQKETGRWKSRWKIRDLLADGRCGQAARDFLTSMDVGRLVPPLKESDAGSQV